MTASQDGASEDGKWQEFLTRPSAYIHNGNLVALFDGAVSAELCERLAAEPRLASRLSALVESQFALPAWDNTACTEPDRAVAMMALPDTLTLIRRAGVIYWSASIAAVVMAPDIRALYATVGEELCAWAVRHRDLSGPARPVKPFETLIERIDADGRLCFAAWMAAQPAAVSSRAWLKWPEPFAEDEEMVGPFRELGPAIVRRAASM